MVTNQVIPISFVISHRILFILSAAPEPIIDELMMCGVLTGKPKMEAMKINPMEVTCESSAFNGLIR